MMTFLAILFLQTQFVPVNPSLHTDKIVSFDCLRSDYCLVLDESGNLYFSDDQGSTLVLRARLRAHGILKIRFSGLLLGWGLDKRGRIWKTRNSGRLFARFRPKDIGVQKVLDFLLDRDKKLVLLVDNGRVYRLDVSDQLVVLTKDELRRTGIFVVSDRSLQLQGALNFPLLSFHHSPPDVYDVETFGEKFVVRSHENGRIEFSNDKGKTWLSKSLLHKPPVRLCYVNARKVFVLQGHHEILSSADAGKSWIRHGVWDGLLLNDLHFITARQGWAVGNKGSLLRTRDGGRNWTLDRIDPPIDLNRIRFVDPMVGFAIGEMGSVLKTTDGGKKFEQVLSVDTDLHATYFNNRMIGWVAGDHGDVFFTEDGGANWSSRSIASDTPIQALSFVDQDRGLAGSTQGLLFLTHDQGRHWQEIDTNTTADLLDISCFQKNHGCLVAGSRGLFLWGSPFYGR
jgi:photosystem II stability/assembly factor-like uncharacterized protein